MRMGWAGYVARIEAIRNEYNDLVGKPEGEETFSVTKALEKMIILEWILEKESGKLWTGFI
jgi:hypothetical protein